MKRQNQMIERLRSCRAKGKVGEGKIEARHVRAAKDGHEKTHENERKRKPKTTRRRSRPSSISLKRSVHSGDLIGGELIANPAPTKSQSAQRSERKVETEGKAWEGGGERTSVRQLQNDAKNEEECQFRFERKREGWVGLRTIGRRTDASSE